MNNITNINLNDLEMIIGGKGYGSIFHPSTWWQWLESNSPGGTPPVCEQYTPAYPGKVLPPC